MGFAENTLFSRVYDGELFSVSLVFSAVALIRTKGEPAANAVVTMVIVAINATANQSFVVIGRSFLQFTKRIARLI